ADTQPAGRGPVEPGQEAKRLSQTRSQSSSRPLHVSVGGTHEPHAHEPVHVRAPVEPQEVGHGAVVPAQQVKPLSQTKSQSSSTPLQTSVGGRHGPYVHDGARQVSVPTLEQDVVHA